MDLVAPAKRELECQNRCRYLDARDTHWWKLVIDPHYLERFGDMIKFTLVENTSIKFVSKRKRLKLEDQGKNLSNEKTYEFGAVKTDPMNDHDWFFARSRSYEAIFDMKQSNEEWSLVRCRLTNRGKLKFQSHNNIPYGETRVERGTAYGETRVERGISCDCTRVARGKLLESINPEAVQAMLSSYSAAVAPVAAVAPAAPAALAAVAVHLRAFLLDYMRVRCILPHKKNAWPFCIDDVAIRTETWGGSRLLVVRVRIHPSFTQSSEGVLEVVLAMCGQSMNGHSTTRVERGTPYGETRVERGTPYGETRVERGTPYGETRVERGTCPIHYGSAGDSNPFCCQNAQIKMNFIKTKQNKGAQHDAITRTRVADHVPLGALRRRYLCSLVTACWFSFSPRTPETDTNVELSIDELNVVSELIARSPHFQPPVLDNMEKAVVELKRCNIVRKRVREGGRAGRWKLTTNEPLPKRLRSTMQYIDNTALSGYFEAVW